MEKQKRKKKEYKNVPHASPYPWLVLWYVVTQRSQNIRAMPQVVSRLTLLRQAKRHTPALWTRLCNPVSLTWRISHFPFPQTEMLILSLLMSLLCSHLFLPHSALSPKLLCNYINGDWHRCNISAVLDERLLTACDCWRICHHRLAVLVPFFIPAGVVKPLAITIL